MEPPVILGDPARTVDTHILAPGFEYEFFVCTTWYECSSTAYDYCKTFLKVDIVFSIVDIMVLILDGNSEIGAHLRTNFVIWSV